MKPGQKDRQEEHPQDQHGGNGGMASRGVTRPMAEMKMRGGHGEKHQQREGEEQHRDGEQQENEKGGEGGHHMSRENRLEMLHMHHKQTLWIYWTLVMAGIWMMLAPVTFGYLNSGLWTAPADRGPWFSEQPHMELRAWLMTGSDIAAGLLLVVFGWRSLTPNRPVSLWTCCFIGMWLNVAPVIFWAPTAASYLNGTLVGALLIGLTIMVPGMPNMIMYMQHGPPRPPGWSYNPSSWPQRWIMIVTGFAGWVVSRYLAAYQLGYIDQVWDPFFAAGSQKVLESEMSKTWPISDGALGGLSYTFEFLMGFMGSPARWRTMPWMVTFFGVLVIPLGLTHIFLVISQPVVVHHWCSLCLLAAAIMLPMIPLEVDEVVAMIQHVVQAKRRGDRGGSLWKIFWKGGSAEGCAADERSPELIKLPQHPWKLFLASIWGMSFPWTLAVSAAIGVWLMFSPTVFGVDIHSTAADVGHLGGALIVTVSVICMGEVVRIGRFLNVLLGLIVAIAPWLVAGGSVGFAASAAVAGAAAVALAIPRGQKRETYGSWDRFVR